MKKSLAVLVLATAALAFAQNAPKSESKPACPQQKCCCKGCAQKDPSTCKAKKACPKQGSCPKAAKG